MIEQTSAILIAVLAALLYAIGSYLKQTPPEEFNEEKFFVTCLLGLAIGGVSYYCGLTYGAAEQLLISAGLVVYIEVWGKALYRRLRRWTEEMQKDMDK